MQERITCYKLCYIMGVLPQDLEYNFAAEHRIAKRFRWEENKQSAKAARATALIWRRLMQRFHNTSEIDKEVNGFISEHLGKDGVTYQRQPNESRLGWLNRLATVYDSQLNAAWESLNIAIPFDVFRDVVHLPVLNAHEMEAYTMIAKYTSHIYDIQFYGKDVLNVATGIMLSSDIALGERLAVFTNHVVNSVRDCSLLGAEIRRYLDAVVVSSQFVQSHSQYAQLVDGNKPEKRIVRLLDTFSALIDGECSALSVVSQSQLSGLQEGTLVITTSIKLATIGAKKFPKLDFAVLLPVDKRSFRNLQRRSIPNLYAIDATVILGD